MPGFLRTALIGIFTLPIALFGQYFTIGTDPASVRWDKIKTEHFKIIYPRELDSQAVYMANALEYFREAGSASLGVQTRKWPVILHNRTLISNAFVPYAPKRVEILTTPPQDNHAQSWTDGLIIHEFRHVAQYTAINRGMTRAFSVLFGQQAVPAVIGLFVPLWFIEGDAVAIETANSQTGRGRLPSFEMRLRAQFLEKGIYSYDKAVNESFKDFTPNRYELGYQLVGRTRTEFGSKTWERALRKTGNVPLMMVPFSNTLYRETGFGKARLYRDITQDMMAEWKADDASKDLTLLTPLLQKTDKLYTSRTQAVVAGAGAVIARRTSIGDIARIVSIDSAGNEQIVTTPGSMIDEGLGGRGRWVCWAELAPDPRWDLRNHTVIKMLDTETGQIRRITGKSRYFSPDISRDGSRIAAIEVRITGESFLVIINVDSARVIHRHPAPEQYFLSYPAWADDGRTIALIMTRDEGKTLALADAETGEFHHLLPFSNTEISKPAFYGEFILFTGAYTGTDNIFALHRDSRKLYQVTEARFGATDAAPDPAQDLLYYSDYTASGYRIVRTPLIRSQWIPADPLTEPVFPLAEKLAGQENFIFDAEAVPDSAYAIKPYRKAGTLFNLHSWAPLAVDLDNMDANPGVTLLSQNLLGTSYMTLGYEYDLYEETGRYYLDYSYEGLYPAFNLFTDYSLRRGAKDLGHGQVDEFRYHEFNVGGGVRIPLNWNVRSWFMGFQPYAGYAYKRLKMAEGEELEFRKDRIHSSENRIFGYAQSRMAQRDLQPRWGQVLEFNYRFTPGEGDSISSIFAAEALFYLPGLARHHGLRLYAGYQDRFSAYYRYGGLINAPRGYGGISADRAVSFSAGYVLPLFYPDWNAGPVFYLKRIKAGLFFDHLTSFDASPFQHYNSIGLDVSFDFHLFRLFAPLEAGLRTVYLPGENDVVFEFLYRLNLEGIY